MSMSMHVVGRVSDKDPTYLKHKAVLLACDAAGIEKLPKETAEYFGDDSPEPCYLKERLEVEVPISYHDEDYATGFILNVKEIPEGVEKIFFYCSW